MDSRTYKEDWSPYVEIGLIGLRGGEMRDLEGNGIGSGAPNSAE
jgi:hypothetical protein